MGIGVARRTRIGSLVNHGRACGVSSTGGRGLPRRLVRRSLWRRRKREARRRVRKVEVIMFGSTVQWRRGINVLVLAAVTGAGAMAQTPAPPPVSREQLLETHMKDEKSGSAAAGRPVYDQLCAGCHRFGAIGKDVGPDLTTLTSRFKRRDILEAILWPSKIISDQYQSEMLELSDGSIVTGVLVRENASALL